MTLKFSLPLRQGPFLAKERSNQGSCLSSSSKASTVGCELAKLVSDEEFISTCLIDSACMAGHSNFKRLQHHEFRVIIASVFGRISSPVRRFGQQEDQSLSLSRYMHWFHEGSGNEQGNDLIIGPSTAFVSVKRSCRLTIVD
jgi:hypothetical protein